MSKYSKHSLSLFFRTIDTRVTGCKVDWNGDSLIRSPLWGRRLRTDLVRAPLLRFGDETSYREMYVLTYLIPKTLFWSDDQQKHLL